MQFSIYIVYDGMYFCLNSIVNSNWFIIPSAELAQNTFNHVAWRNFRTA